MIGFFSAIDKFFVRIKAMSFVKVLLIAWGINLVWVFVVGGILLLCGASFSQHVAPGSMFQNSFLMLPFAAFAEEVLFRWIPMLVLNFVLMFFYRTGKISKEKFFYLERYCLLILVAVSCLIFGYVHGNIFNILLQGFSGILIFIIYLRCFFIERDKGVNDRLQVLPLAEATLFHSLSNLLSAFV